MYCELKKIKKKRTADLAYVVNISYIAGVRTSEVSAFLMIIVPFISG